jgi:hypothetical protein
MSMAAASRRTESCNQGHSGPLVPGFGAELASAASRRATATASPNQIPGT